MKKLGAEKFAT